MYSFRNGKLLNTLAFGCFQGFSEKKA